MKTTIETYSGRTGKDGRPELISSQEVEVADPQPTTEDEIQALKARVAILEAKLK